MIEQQFLSERKQKSCKCCEVMHFCITFSIKKHFCDRNAYVRSMKSKIFHKYWAVNFDKKVRIIQVSFI